ncbi:hypothetical protein FQZ97_781710 [compost metagenome]
MLRRAAQGFPSRAQCGLGLRGGRWRRDAGEFGEHVVEQCIEVGVVAVLVVGVLVLMFCPDALLQISQRTQIASTSGEPTTSGKTLRVPYP